MQTKLSRLSLMLGVALASSGAFAADPPAVAKPKTMADVIAASRPSDWRTLDPQNLLNVDFVGLDRVVIELAPAFAPKHVENIKALAREDYYDNLALLRVQDNYVAQWGDPNSEDKEKAKPIQKAKRTLPAEFDRDAKDLPFTALPDGDVYAPQVGFSDGFPVARDPATGKAWLAHCYGMVGVGRDNDANSGGGTELYAVIGHAPRHLDRNVTLVGRVVYRIDQLASQPRGTKELGFYADPGQQIPLSRVRVAADRPVSDRVELEALRTDTETFKALVESRRNRRDDWYKTPAGKIELCNVPLIVREKAKAPEAAKKDAAKSK